MISASDHEILKVKTDIYVDIDKAKSTTSPLIWDPSAGGPFCFCMVTAMSLRDSVRIFKEQVWWAKRKDAKWYRIYQLMKYFDNTHYQGIASGIKSASESTNRILIEALYIPKAWDASRNRNNKQFDYDAFVAKLAMACWYVFLDYKCVSMYKRMGNLIDVMTGGGKAATGLRLVDHINEYLPSKLRRNQWGVSGIIMIAFRIFSEFLCPNINPTPLFSKQAKSKAPRISREIIDCFKSERFRDNLLLSELNLSLKPPIDKDELVWWCLERIAILFKAYLFNFSLDYWGGKSRGLKYLHCDDQFREFAEPSVRMDYLNNRLSGYCDNAKDILNRISNSRMGIPDRDLIIYANQLILNYRDIKRSVSLILGHCFQYYSPEKAAIELNNLYNNLDECITTHNYLSALAESKNDCNIKIYLNHTAKTIAWEMTSNSAFVDSIRAIAEKEVNCGSYLQGKTLWPSITSEYNSLLTS